MTEPGLYRFSHVAMATTYEIVFPSASGGDEAMLRLEGAANACWRELDRLEEELSRFRGNSDISRINRLGGGRRTRVGLAAFDCLSVAKAVHAETDGAFDITVGPLMAIWRTPEGMPRQATTTEFEHARANTGSHLFTLNAEDRSISVEGAGLAIDLGGLGKGYALDQMVAVLEEWRIPAALLNAGDSTVYAHGSPDSEEEGWELGAEGAPGGVLHLRDRALSGSGFAVQGDHIMNPRTGMPVEVPKDAARTWATAPTATMADALSTAFAVMGPKEINDLCARHSEVEAYGTRNAEGGLGK